MRAFLAVIPPREAREKVEAMREPLRELAPRGRWVHPSLWHLTLKFLGEVEDELIPAVADLVGQMVAEINSFEVVLSGVGVFPNADRPRTLWVGLTQGAEELSALAEMIDVGLDGLGFEPEEEKLQPHLTLARFRDQWDAGEIASAIGSGEEIARFTVTEVCLMKSVLRPRGPDYSVVEKLALIPPPEPEPSETGTTGVEAEGESEPTGTDEPGTEPTDD